MADGVAGRVRGRGMERAEGVGVTVGAQVRRLREFRGLSVAELSRLSGVSRATLSMLESGRGNPTIETVSAIAVALRLPLGDLLVDPTPPEPVLRPGTPRPQTSRQDLLDRIGAGGHSEIWRLRLCGAGRRVDSPPHTRGTLERVVALRGRLRLGPVDRPVVLATGDFVVFPADEPHFYEAVDDEDVDAVIVMTYPAAS
ncbi:putative DNA binding regulatory protein [Streptantibioticus cattleyicolor NRRL 8057 = DSM 46488]|uniref:Putative DNA binding regulatory protein n=1 Tax=Streptantibioticus cattleyicolor (strain ATCC 35852 / DSM 46488 / JCM 4925 / NBRC 14057 / NRRL 8057) TaxID=1003195 RepID=G8X0D0_STREN|nr:putative DNA binding regulatory protein [Streptantibioticus cattleyicolor NRRL 8057 = DSM 46488]